MARKKNTGEVMVAKCDLKEITQVENRIFTIRGEQVIIDSDLAKLCGTVTKDLTSRSSVISRVSPQSLCFS